MVLWTPSIVDAGWVRQNTKPDADLVDLARLAEDEITEIYRRAVRDKLRVVRMHAGDLSSWGGLRAQLELCARLQLPAEVVPGVSPMSATAASAGVSLTEPDFADSVITAGQETTGMPDLEQIRQYAQFGTTMAVVVPAARAGELADALRAGGFDDSTPVVAAYKVSWPDEIVARTTIGELLVTVKQHRLWRHTLFLVGGAVRAGKTRSAGDASRRSQAGEGVVRWSRNRSSWTKRATPAPEPEAAPEPEPVEKPQRVTVVAEPVEVAEPAAPVEAEVPVRKPAPAKAAAASTATKTVTAQAKKPAPRTTAAKTAAAAKAAAAKQPAKAQAKTPVKKSTGRAQPQRGRRV